MTAISRHIKEKMIEKGLSAHALEKQAGLKLSAVQNIMYGRSKNPSINILASIAQALGCTVSDLLEEGHLSTQRAGSNVGPSFSQTTPWNADLYINTLHVINISANAKNLSLSQEQLFKYADETYAYSIKNKKNKPDKNFAEWLVEKSFDYKP